MLRLLIAAFLLLSVAMYFIDAFIQTEITPLGIVSFEFIANLENFNQAMTAWDEKAKIAVGLSLGVDFLYLLLYTGILYITLQGFYRSRSFTLFNTMSYVAIMAGFLDALENISLIQLLLGSPLLLWAQLAYCFATIKFLLLLLCLMVIIFGFLQRIYLRYKK